MYITTQDVIKQILPLIEKQLPNFFEWVFV